MRRGNQSRISYRKSVGDESVEDVEDVKGVEGEESEKCGCYVGCEGRNYIELFYGRWTKRIKYPILINHSHLHLHFHFHFHSTF